MRLTRMGRIVRVGARSLLLHKLRTMLSVLGIIFGVAAVVSMLSIGEGAKQEAIKQIRQLGAENVIVRRVQLTPEQESEARKKLSWGLILKDTLRIRNGVPDIDAIVPVREIKAPLLGLGGLRREGAAPEVLAVGAGYLAVKGLEVKEGRFLAEYDISEGNSVCVIGYEIANLLGTAGKCGETIRLGERLFTIVGILQSTQWIKGKTPALSARNANRAVLIPLPAGRSLVTTPASYTPVDEIIIRCRDASDVTRVGRLTEAVLSHQHHGVPDYQVIVPQELIRQTQQTQRIFNIVLGCIAGISLLVGGIGIMNIMLATVSERTREIGIRRAVGASRSHIVIQFLVEAVLLTLSGGVIGLAVGLIGARFISMYAGWQTIVTVWSVLLSLGTSVLVGTFFGLYPAYQASLLDPIEALRYE